MSSVLDLVVVAVAVAIVGEGCYLKHLPITDQIAAGSTFAIASQGRDGRQVMGIAWAIDERHLLTSGIYCAGAEDVALGVDHGWLPVVVHYDVDRLMCMLDAPAHVQLEPLYLASDSIASDSKPGPARSATEIPGSPEWRELGIVGMMLDGHRRIGLDGIKTFARAHGATPKIAPPLSDVDMDLSCQGTEKARGDCTP